MFNLAFAQGTQQTATGQPGGNLMGLLPIAIIFIIFYFLLIRPQKKSQREHQDMLQKLSKNDEVITSGGIFGTVVSIQDDVVTLRVEKETKIKVKKGSVSKVIKSRGEEVSG